MAAAHFASAQSLGLPKEQWLASAGAGARFSALGLLWTSEIGVPLALSRTHRGIRAFFSATKIL